MSEEEKKAIECLGEEMYPGKDMELEEITLFPKGIKDIKTVLNLIQKQQAELEKKDKIIDLMAEMLVKVPNNADNPQSAVIVAMMNRDLELRKIKIKQYFERKIENEC